MSLLVQLFRQKIGDHFPQELDDIFFHLLREEKHLPKNLLQDINMLCFSPGDYYEGGFSLLECLENSLYCHSIEDYLDNYSENNNCRRAMAPLRSVKYLEEELEEYSHISKRDYQVISEAIREYPEQTGVDIVNIIRNLRNGKLNYEIHDNDCDASWSSGNLDLYDMDTTTMIIYKEEITLNDKYINSIEDFLDIHMYPKCMPLNNDYGFIWLSSDDINVYGRLILKQEGIMNENYWERAGADIFE